MTIRVALIYGSVRSERQEIRAAYYLQGKLQERSIKVDLIDPLEYPLPLLDKMLKEFIIFSRPDKDGVNLDQEHYELNTGLNSPDSSFEPIKIFNYDLLH